MIKSRTESFGWILPCLCVAYSIVWFSWECHAQGSVPDPANGIVINLTRYNITLTAGDTLNITAYYLSSPPAHYAIWFKDNVPLVSYNISSTIVGRYLPCPPFVVINVGCSDAGIYRLFINNSLGSHYSNPLAVSVIIPNNVPYDPYDNPNPYCMHAPFCRPGTSTNRSSTNIFIQEGRSERLLVDVRANPNLTFADWFYNIDLVNRSDPRYIDGDADNPSLFIQSVERTDAGIYTLYANNSIGSLRTPDCVFNLTVGYLPELNCGCNTSNCLVVNETESCHFPVNNIDAYPPVISVQWYKAGNPITTPGGQYQGGTITTPSLTVVDTNRNNTGNYNISVSNIVGAGQCACCCIVQYLPLCTLLSNSPLVVNEFSTFTINVTLESLPPADTVGWTKNGSPVNRTGGRFLNGNSYGTPSLTIRNATRRETGVYVLYASNLVGNITDHTRCRVDITIQHLPLCTLLSNSALVFNELSTFTINVTLESVPPAHTVGWTKDDSPVNRTGGRFLNGNSYGTPSLTIRNATRRETGIYVLNAINTVGNITDHTICRVNVTIQYVPECRDVSANYSACEDAPVTVECIVDALPPIDSVTWRKDGRILNVSNPRYSGGNVSTPSLTINRLISGDSGTYECHVGNVVGTAVCPRTLEVPAKPAVNVTRTNIVLIEGQNSSLGCSVDMRTNPPPVVVQWFKDGVRIETNSGRYQHGDLDIPSLTITNIQREDAGVYSCGAINSIGDRQSSNIVVTVEYPPVVKVPYNNYGFPLYTDATLRCSVDANPPVHPSNITWVLDGSFTIPSEHCTDARPNLQVCSVVPASAGLYRCRAIHRLATKHSEDIRVHVRDECHIIIEEVRLVGSTSSSGRVEVRIGTTWGTVCGRYWTPLATQAVCRMFSYSYGSSSMNGAGTGPIHIGHVRCGSGATTLGDCDLTSISNCTHQEDIWVQCSSIPLTTVVAVPTTTTTAPTTTVCLPVATDGYLLATIILGVLLFLSSIVNFRYIFVQFCSGNKKQTEEKHSRGKREKSDDCGDNDEESSCICCCWDISPRKKDIEPDPDPAPRPRKPKLNTDVKGGRTRLEIDEPVSKPFVQFCSGNKKQTQKKHSRGNSEKSDDCGDNDEESSCFFCCSNVSPKKGDQTEPKTDSDSDPEPATRPRKPKLNRDVKESPCICCCWDISPRKKDIEPDPDPAPRPRKPKLNTDVKGGRTRLEIDEPVSKPYVTKDDNKKDHRDNPKPDKNRENEVRKMKRKTKKEKKPLPEFQEDRWTQPLINPNQFDATLDDQNRRNRSIDKGRTQTTIHGASTDDTLSGDDGFLKDDDINRVIDGDSRNPAGVEGSDGRSLRSRSDYDRVEPLRFRHRRDNGGKESRSRERRKRRSRSEDGISDRDGDSSEFPDHEYIQYNHRHAVMSAQDDPVYDNRNYRAMESPV